MVRRINFLTFLQRGLEAPISAFLWLPFIANAYLTKYLAISRLGFCLSVFLCATSTTQCRLLPTHFKRSTARCHRLCRVIMIVWLSLPCLTTFALADSNERSVKMIVNGADNSADSETSTLDIEHSSSPTARSHTSTPKNFEYESTDVVDWDGPSDTGNPRNWTKRRRWVVTLVVSLFTFIRSAFHAQSSYSQEMTSILVLLGRLYLLQLSQRFRRIWESCPGRAWKTCHCRSSSSRMLSEWVYCVAVTRHDSWRRTLAFDMGTFVGTLWSVGHPSSLQHLVFG